MRTLTFIVPEEYEGARLKGFLRGPCSMSAHLIKQLKCIDGGLMVNGEHATVRHFLARGDVVRACLPQDGKLAVPHEAPLSVLYEDADLLAVNKPSGVTMYPTPGHDTGLTNAVAWHLYAHGEAVTARPIYRLDCDTTGVTIFAKNAYCAAKLSAQPQKSYYAVCEGVMEGTGRIEAPIAVSKDKRVQRCVSPQGQYSATNWRALCTGAGHTLLLLSLETGRTHQIRVHMAHISHPLAGDDMYGGSTALIPRQALHCGEARFLHPVTGAQLCLQAPFPSDIIQLLSDCKMELPDFEIS